LAIEQFPSCKEQETAFWERTNQSCRVFAPVVDALLADQHTAAYANLLQLAVQISEMPQFRDGADHLHIVIRRPQPE
jgi:hypothetical protein